MPIQAPQWTEFLSCPVCCNEFAANLRPPISLGCGHTICRTCLATLHHRQCPFDQTVISTDLDYLPINNALLQLVSAPGSSGSSSSYGTKGVAQGGGSSSSTNAVTASTSNSSSNKPVGNGGSASPGPGSSQGAVCGSSNSNSPTSSVSGSSGKSSSSSSSSSASSSSSTSSGSSGTNSSIASPSGGGGGGGGGLNATATASGGVVDPDLCSTSVQSLGPEDLQCYIAAKTCIEELALYLKPCPAGGSGSGGSSGGGGGGGGVGSSGAAGCSGTGGGGGGSLLSRQMQRKLVILVNCQLIEDEGRARSLRAARSLGERTVMELILHHQNPQQLSTNLWAAVRARGCQFLGPAMQEEVLKLVLLALEDGSALSRKVLVMFVVQRLEPHFSQASKTSIGHVVQLLYRASCFKVSKREGDSSLMQLKEEFRTYEALRREHDAQIVQIATEAGLRIAPDQWSSLLYGDTAHKSHMQSINDKLQTPQSFVQSVQELIIALQRTGDPANLSGLRMDLKHLASIDWNAENHIPSWGECAAALQSVKRVVAGLVDFVQHHGNRKLQEAGHLAHNRNYKISLCRDLNNRGTCPRGPNCTFAHSEEELEKYRTKLRKNHSNSAGPGGAMRLPNGKDHHQGQPSSGSTIGGGGGGGGVQLLNRARSGMDYHSSGGLDGGGGGGGMHQSSSSSHGYHSSGEEASPVRSGFQKNVVGGSGGASNHRMIDKSPIGSHTSSGGSNGGGTNNAGTNGAGGHHLSAGGIHSPYAQQQQQHQGPMSQPSPMSMNGGRGGSYGPGHYQQQQHGGNGVGNAGSYHHPGGRPPHHQPHGPTQGAGGGGGGGGGVGHHNNASSMRYRPPPHMGSGSSGGNGGGNGGGGGYLSAHPSMLQHGSNRGDYPPPSGVQQQQPGLSVPPGHHHMDQHHNPLQGEYLSPSLPGDKMVEHHQHHHGHHQQQQRRGGAGATGGNFGWDNLASPQVAMAGQQQPQTPHLSGAPHLGKGGSSVQQQQGSYGGGPPLPPPPPPPGSNVKWNGHMPPPSGAGGSGMGSMGSKYMSTGGAGGSHHHGQHYPHHHKMGSHGASQRDYKEKQHRMSQPSSAHGLGGHHAHLPFAGARNGSQTPYLSSPLPPMAGGVDPSGVAAGNSQIPVGGGLLNGHNSGPGYHHHMGAPVYQQQRSTGGDGFLPKLLFDATSPGAGGGKKPSYSQQLINQQLNDIGMPNQSHAVIKDMFTRSDSLLADDDALMVAEQEFNNSASSQYGPISRMNPIGTERIDLGLTPRTGQPAGMRGTNQRGLWSNSSLGESPSPTGSGSTGQFYHASDSQPMAPPPPHAIQQHKQQQQQQQQQQLQQQQHVNVHPHHQHHPLHQQQLHQHPYHAQHHAGQPTPMMTGKIVVAPEPNNNTLDFDALLHVDKKAMVSEYERHGSSTATIVDCCVEAPGGGPTTTAADNAGEPDFLLQSLVSPTAQQYGQPQQQQHQQQQQNLQHHHHHHHHQQQQQQQHQQQHHHHHQQHQQHYPSMVGGASAMLLGDIGDSSQQQQLMSGSQVDRCNGASMNERLAVANAQTLSSPACLSDRSNEDQRKLMDMKSPQSSLSGMQSPSGMILSVASESSSCPTPPSGTTGSSAGPGSMWNTLPSLDLPSLKPSPLAADTPMAIGDPNDPDAPGGRANGAAGGYPLVGAPAGSQAFFMRQQDKLRLNKMLMDPSAAGQQQQQCFLGQQTNGGGSLGFHEMLNTNTASQPNSPNCLTDRTGNVAADKLTAFNELNDLRIQQSAMQTATSAMLTTTSSPSSTGTGSVDAANNNNGLAPESTPASMWNLASLKSSLSVSPSVLVVDPTGQSPPVVATAATASNSSIMNTSKSSSCEDSYEAGIADDMRELELRLESELQLDENGI